MQNNQAQLNTGTGHLRSQATYQLRFRAGVPIHAVLDAEIAPERLRAALRGKPVVSVTLDDSDVEYEYYSSHDPPLGQLVPALAASARQLTALTGSSSGSSRSAAAEAGGLFPAARADLAADAG